MTNATVNRIDTCGSLSREERARMYALFASVYAGTGLEAFLRDLSDKQWVVRIFDAQGGLAGFTTVRLEPDSMDGKDLLYVFSGDTVMAKRARGGSALAGCFAHVLQRASESARGASVWWVLLSKGHRTYRFLPLYFRRWHPMPGRRAEAPELDLLDRFCRRRYGHAWKSAQGLVVFEPLRDRLNDEEAVIPERKRQDPYVSYFLSRNPGFARGDELACLAEIAETNMNPRCWTSQGATPVVWGF